NGCRTTSVTPEEALNLVNPLVTNSGASGVIGTEITVFESLATAFAEAFFEEFVVKKHAAGEAVRRARLQLLKKKRNPLGLVYIPFVLPGLCLRPPVVPQSYV
ncbi:MAG TPA: CHAT domain-containing protein, partial [Candidatus Limnocylindrales bacterium]|nr:CHAT domain-containing protein [Candidatus Limnocylindrales bacterium]